MERNAPQHEADSYPRSLSPPGWFGLWFDFDHVNSTQQGLSIQMFQFSAHVQKKREKKKKKSEVDGWMKG